MSEACWSASGHAARHNHAHSVHQYLPNQDFIQGGHLDCMSPTPGADAWVQDHGSVLLHVHGRFADWKKNHREACALWQPFEGHISASRDTTSLADNC